MPRGSGKQEKKSKVERKMGPRIVRVIRFRNPSAPRKERVVTEIKKDFIKFWRAWALVKYGHRYDSEQEVFDILKRIYRDQPREWRFYLRLYKDDRQYWRREARKELAASKRASDARKAASQRAKTTAYARR